MEDILDNLSKHFYTLQQEHDSFMSECEKIFNRLFRLYAKTLGLNYDNTDGVKHENTREDDCYCFDILLTVPYKKPTNILKIENKKFRFHFEIWKRDASNIIFLERKYPVSDGYEDLITKMNLLVLNTTYNSAYEYVFTKDDIKATGFVGEIIGN